MLGDGKTAVIEMAAASGLHLAAGERRDPRITTSFGTGELILAALDRGVSAIILGIGGSATNDGGAGMMQALGLSCWIGRGSRCRPAARRWRIWRGLSLTRWMRACVG
ncbi:glycerate kinase I [Serratia rubidaea]|uniref:Glycerate kinase I n=1 Tax=Serratia rubidaea TaxID=61652 RepID=A0A3S5DFE0_SERRU|nr:glycerate kinase I [Serratia rubidaea]